MAEDIDTVLYHLDRIDDELGEGYRISTSQDEFMEVRQHEDIASCVYTDRYGNWKTKVRSTDTDRGDAWDVFRDFGETIDDMYDTSISIDQRSFHKTLEDDGYVKESSGDSLLEYSPSSRWELPETTGTELAGKALTAAGYIGKWGGGGGAAGGTIGGALGFLAGGPPGAALGATAGGAVVGGIALMERTMDLQFDRHRQRRIRQKISDRSSMINRWRGKWYQKKDLSQREGILRKLNRRNGLDTVLTEAESYDSDRNSDLDGLEAEDLDEQFGLVKEIAFTKVEQLPGVTAIRSNESYAEAQTFIAGLTEVEIDEPNDEPTIYQNPDAFRTMLDHLTYEDEIDGETVQQVADDGKTMIENALTQDERHPEIYRFIDESYPDIASDIGDELLYLD